MRLSGLGKNILALVFCWALLYPFQPSADGAELGFKTTANSTREDLRLCATYTEAISLFFMNVVHSPRVLFILTVVLSCLLGVISRTLVLRWTWDGLYSRDEASEYFRHEESQCRPRWRNELYGESGSGSSMFHHRRMLWYLAFLGFVVLVCVCVLWGDAGSAGEHVKYPSGPDADKSGYKRDDSWLFKASLGLYPLHSVPCLHIVFEVQLYFQAADIQKRVFRVTPNTDYQDAGTKNGWKEMWRKARQVFRSMETIDHVLGIDVPCEDKGPPQSQPSPAKTLRVYRRAILGRKHIFAESSFGLVQYFINNPVPNKHANMWKPVFYRSDNPKYTPETKAIARARRRALWDSFRIELGDGIDQVLQNDRRVRERKWHHTKQKFRRWFWMKPTPPKKRLEQVQEVKGFVMPLKMRKLVNSDNEVVATFEKDRWASVKKAEKTTDSANKKKSYLGTLSIYPSAYSDSTVSCIDHTKNNPPQDQCDNIRKRKNANATKDPNLDRAHSGDLTEEAIVVTYWVVIEAEHRLHYKVFDVLQAIGEIVGG
ncbi:hypothetical protein QQZ08_005694 [Neonectria magnoliae]|uniref:Uncharacterized protein n=1 Tax=Neonectria magnoliae TaxID=2732573 RepID=A0ABR1I4I1_9HYPO